MLVIDSNPADPVSFDVKDEVERELFTEAEARAIIDAVEGEWKTLLRIGHYTGLRLMTAATLGWGRRTRCNSGAGTA
jgi:integrase